MEVQGMEMYHYHRGRYYNDMWKVGNEIIVSESFYSSFGMMLREFDTSVICNGNNLAPFDSIIEKCLEESLENFNLKYIEGVMEKARRLILETSIYNRELALERYRLEHFPQLPSRLHSLWFCDQEASLYWNPPYTEGYDREYLFQGKVKVFEQLCIDDKK